MIIFFFCDYPFWNIRYTGFCHTIIINSMYEKQRHFQLASKSHVNWHVSRISDYLVVCVCVCAAFQFVAIVIAHCNEWVILHSHEGEHSAFNIQNYSSRMENFYLFYLRFFCTFLVAASNHKKKAGEDLLWKLMKTHIFCSVFVREQFAGYDDFNYNTIYLEIHVWISNLEVPWKCIILTHGERDREREEEKHTLTLEKPLCVVL